MNQGICAVILLCTPLMVLAAPRQNNLALHTKPSFAHWDENTIKSMLPAPPALNSPADRRDFAEILGWQRLRTPIECAAAQREVAVSLSTFFGYEGGPLSPLDVARLDPLFWRLAGETNYVTQIAKKQWDRPRPYNSDPRVEPCTEKEVTAAYPSGHAAIARVFERALIQIFPKRAAAIRHRAHEIALHRVIVGMHHPTDIAAGTTLGDKIFERVSRSPAYRSQLARLSIDDKRSKTTADQ